MVTDMEESDSGNGGSVTPQFIYPEESNNEDSLSDPPSAEPTLEPGTPSEKYTKEPISEPDYDALSEPSMTTREDSMVKLDPRDIVRYQKG